jgi:hypothetical protein
MTKLKWDREPVRSTLNSDYWNDPKKGFDKDWHIKQQFKKEKNEKILNQKIELGIHKDHDLDIIPLTSGPHSSKLICITCNNKFIRWLSKGITI